MTPTLEVKPGDAEYAALHEFWLKSGQPGTMEKMSAGWQYRAIRPDTAETEPTFVLIVSSPLTDALVDGPPRGYAALMGTRQSTLPGRIRELPKT